MLRQCYATFNPPLRVSHQIGMPHAMRRSDCRPKGTGYIKCPLARVTPRPAHRMGRTDTRRFLCVAPLVCLVRSKSRTVQTDQRSDP